MEGEVKIAEIAKIESLKTQGLAPQRTQSPQRLEDRSDTITLASDT
jgi:hypothetical protein